MHNDAITINNLRFTYDDTFTLNIAGLRIQNGTFAFLLGPNGAGKTTLFELICGVLKPEAGTIFIENNHLAHIKQRDIARRVAFVAQDSTYVFPFTVEEIVLMGRYPHSPYGTFESKEDEEKARWAMEMTNTYQFRARSILTLSGGERRRVEIARALCQEARILLLDEPSSHLDIKQQRLLFQLLHSLHTEKKITLFIISHHLNFINQYGQQVFFIQKGGIEEIANKDLLLHEDLLMEKF